MTELTVIWPDQQSAGVNFAHVVTKPYYNILFPIYQETGEILARIDRESGRVFEVRPQTIEFAVIGTMPACSDPMKHAKQAFPKIKNPILEAVGFIPQ